MGFYIRHCADEYGEWFDCEDRATALAAYRAWEAQHRAGEEPDDELDLRIQEMSRSEFESLAQVGFFVRHKLEDSGLWFSVATSEEAVAQWRSYANGSDDSEDVDYVMQSDLVCKRMTREEFVCLDEV